tara:strand:- start:1136 stop:1900 length:765 start_codon:yes stop_codon:yes gene_type:complete
MKCSILIAVLDSHEVVRKQIEYMGEILRRNKTLKEECEIIIIDDGSEKSIANYLTTKWNMSENLYSIYSEEYKSTIIDFGLLLGFKFRVVETNDKTPWSQPRARNIGAYISVGEYLLMTDIDHIFTEESIVETVNFKGDKLVFRRKFAIIDEKLEICRDKKVLMDYGCKEADLEKSGSHANTFAMKREIFIDLLNGYDEKFCGKHGGDDTDLNKRYGELHYKKLVNKHVMGSLIYVYPNPRKDVKRIFHDLRFK